MFRRCRLLPSQCAPRLPCTLQGPLLRLMQELENYRVARFGLPSLASMLRIPWILSCCFFSSLYFSIYHFISVVFDFCAFLAFTCILYRLKILFSLRSLATFFLSSFYSSFSHSLPLSVVYLCLYCFVHSFCLPSCYLLSFILIFPCCSLHLQGK